MTRWQRFKHSFEQCYGPVVSREYIEPRAMGRVNAWGVDSDRLVAEALYGVTLMHHRCSKCGRAFTNRELGDWREESASTPISRKAK